VTHLAEDGRELWSATGFDWPVSVSVDPTDGSCWVADEHARDVVHLSAEGAELWRGGGFSGPEDVSVNPSDGSCWVADGSQVVHLSADEVELWRGGGFGSASAVSVNPTDGSCWVAAPSHNQVVLLSAEGEELWWAGVDDARDLSVDPSDGSCWVADYDNDQVVHLSAEGEELWRGGGFGGPRSVSVDPTDGSCWVADRGNDAVVHLSSSGMELWHGGGFKLPRSVSVDPTDGSCWVADYGNDEVVHLSAEGEELWRGGPFRSPTAVAVDGGRQVVHLVLAAGIPPTASFTATPTGGDAPLVVQFTDHSTRGVTSWSWDFGDGGASLEQHPSHTYTAFGSYTVSLTVADADGSDTETKPDYITVGPLPVADFAGHPTIGGPPLRVEFTDLSTGGPTSWEWDFGDGLHSIHGASAAGDRIRLRAPEGHGPSGGGLLGYVERGSCLMAVGFRGWVGLDRAEPDPRVRRPGQVHGEFDGDE
jgi:PKD repeat protein